MNTLSFRYLERGVGARHGAPINLVLLDKKTIDQAGISSKKALQLIAEAIIGPVAINIIDLEAVTITSEGLACKGAIVTIAAADKGCIHPESGIRHIKGYKLNEDLLAATPVLETLSHIHPKQSLFREPKLKKNGLRASYTCISGKAFNGYPSAKMVNLSTREELWFPILGQLQVMLEGDVTFGITRELFSANNNISSIPSTLFRYKPAARYNKNLNPLHPGIPCILAPNNILAKYIINALKAGFIPGKNFGCSLPILCVARALGSEIDTENISADTWLKLENLGLTKKHFIKPDFQLSCEEIIEHADEIIPCLTTSHQVKSAEYFKIIEMQF